MHGASARHARLIAWGMVLVLMGCTQTKTDSARESGAAGSEDSGEGRIGRRGQGTCHHQVRGSQEALR